MRVGDLNKLIELQKPVETSDSMGGYTTTYSTEYSAWAGIWPLSVNEQLKAGQLAGSVTHRIRIRYIEELRANWRVKFGTRYFNIEGPPINKNERNREFDLICREVEV